MPGVGALPQSHAAAASFLPAAAAPVRCFVLAASSVPAASASHRRSLLASSSLSRGSPRGSAPPPQCRGMFIQTQTTPNPSALKFLPGREVAGAGGSHDFSSFRAASAASPLAALLFGIPGVQGVYLGPDFVSVNVREGSDWALLKPEIFAAIMDFYASGKPVIYEKPTGEGGEADAQSGETRSSTTILPTDSEVVAMIKELIETRIRPAVQEDGGDIDYRSFDETTGIVKVQMQGACKGCASSAITLKNGIENMLMHYVPEVKAVEEEKDEAVEQVSEEQLKKLEDKLAQAKPDASPV